MVDAQKERQRVTAHLDKLSDACRLLRTGGFNAVSEKLATTEQKFAIVEDALFQILQALRLMQGEEDE